MSLPTCTLRSDDRWKLGPMREPSEVLALPFIVEFVDASRALNLRRARAYEQARQGAYPIPLLRDGSTYKAKRCDLLSYLGIQEPAA